ncbi:MAG: hypothetical protein ACFCUH_05475 [Flavobacteriales bacterium]
MKTILFALGLLLSVTAGARTPETAQDRAVKRGIERYVIAPVSGEAAERFGAVFVQFSLDCSGKVHILDVEGNTAYLENHVVERLQRITFEDADESKVYTYRFVFRPEKH